MARVIPRVHGKPRVRDQRGHRKHRARGSAIEQSAEYERREPATQGGSLLLLYKVRLFLLPILILVNFAVSWKLWQMWTTEVPSTTKASDNYKVISESSLPYVAPPPPEEFPLQQNSTANDFTQASATPAPANFRLSDMSESGLPHVAPPREEAEESPLHQDFTAPSLSRGSPSSITAKLKDETFGVTQANGATQKQLSKDSKSIAVPSIQETTLPQQISEPFEVPPMEFASPQSIATWSDANGGTFEPPDVQREHVYLGQQGQSDSYIQEHHSYRVFHYPEDRIPAQKKHKAQYFQDEALDALLFRGHRNGVFVEVGAGDGVFGSNTHFFETQRNWSGICVEPVEEHIKSIRKTRTCQAVHAAVCAKTSVARSFVRVDGLQGRSGFESTMPKRYIREISNQPKKAHVQLIRESVPCINLNELLNKEGLKYIDLLAIDVEGAELEILQSLALHMDAHSAEGIEVAAFLVEVAPGQNSWAIREWMLNHGYSGPWRIDEKHPDDIFLRKDLLPIDLEEYSVGVPVACADHCRCPVPCAEDKWRERNRKNYHWFGTLQCSRTLWAHRHDEKFLDLSNADAIRTKCIRGKIPKYDPTLYEPPDPEKYFRAYEWLTSVFFWAIHGVGACLLVTCICCFAC